MFIMLLVLIGVLLWGIGGDGVVFIMERGGECLIYCFLVLC